MTAPTDQNLTEDDRNERLKLARRIGTLIAVAVGAAIVIAVVMAAFDGTASADAARLEPAGGEPQNPFTPDLRADGFEEVGIPDNGVRGADQLSTATITGQPASAICDVETLREALGDRELRRVWAEAQGINIGQVDAFVAELRPRILIHDAVVTNHGLIDGDAVPSQTILQGGNAVLVDKNSVPRVLCKCGNPLVAATSSTIESTVGNKWKDFDATLVTNIAESQAGPDEPPVEPSVTPGPDPTVTPRPNPTERPSPTPRATVTHSPTVAPQATTVVLPTAVVVPTTAPVNTPTPRPTSPPATSTPTPTVAQPTATPTPAVTPTPEVCKYQELTRRPDGCRGCEAGYFNTGEQCAKVCPEGQFDDGNDNCLSPTPVPAPTETAPTCPVGYQNLSPGEPCVTIASPQCQHPLLAFSRGGCIERAECLGNGFVVDESSGLCREPEG